MHGPRKDARFAFHRRRAVQSAIADLLVFVSEAEETIAL